MSDYCELNGKINLGLCCINTELRKQNIFCSRTMIRKNFTVDKAMDLALKNIHDIVPLVKYNYKNNIKCFRLSSDIFPHFTDKETESYSMEFALNDLSKVGEKCRKYQQRILMHPGQYNQLGAKSKDVLNKTKEDLEHHTMILEAMNIDHNGVLIIHGGGVYGDKESTKRRWLENYDELHSLVKDRLVLENCERHYNIIDCLELYDECGIPIVLDWHHYMCYNQLYPEQELDLLIDDAFPLILESWKDKRPVMHISEQRENHKLGAHSDFITKLPDKFLQLLIANDTFIDLEVEAKMKEQAILKLFKTYPQIFSSPII